ncbi:MAG TPA: DUF3606 domain-containing protein [Chitinophagaceae bacterium]|nr:DUF3606 domain-containing protein [Chitinophagaceae bacterium]
MADDKSKVGRQDRDRVSMSEDYEVEYLHQKYPSKSHEEIKEAIRRHGPSREAIEKSLSGR